MGEARRRREELRASMIEKTRDWMRPPSDFEAALACSIRDLPISEVPRISAADLAYMRMPPNECHANVRWYVKNDPSRETSMATGWLMQWPDYTLHSVLARGDEFRCITPSVLAGEEILHFRPDGRVVWVEDGEFYSPRVDDVEVPLNVRVFPSFTIARAKYVLTRLEAVKNPYDALDIPADDFEHLIRAHVPQEFWPKGLAA